MKTSNKSRVNFGLALAAIYLFLIGSCSSALAETPELSKAVFYVH